MTSKNENTSNHKNMNPTPMTPATQTTFVSAHCHSHKLCWGAILAGAVAALALQIVLMMLGAGLGFAMYNPITSDSPIAGLSAGAAVIQGITAVVSLWFGGWIAGRFLGRAGQRVGCLHGLMVWCLATVLTIGLVSTGAGWALGDLSKIVGGGLSMAGKPVAAAATGLTAMAKESMDRNDGMLSSFLDESMGNNAANTNSTTAIRSKREIGFAIAHLFTMGETNQTMMASNQEMLVTALVNDGGMSQADASKMVDDWKASYQKLKADLDAAKEAAEMRARELAEKTAESLSVLSLCYFVAFVLGAVVAIMGGKSGGACAYKHSETDAELVLND